MLELQRQTAENKAHQGTLPSPLHNRVYRCPVPGLRASSCTRSANHDLLCSPDRPDHAACGCIDGEHRSSPTCSSVRCLGWVLSTWDEVPTATAASSALVHVHPVCQWTNASSYYRKVVASPRWSQGLGMVGPDGWSPFSRSAAPFSVQTTLVCSNYP